MEQEYYNDPADLDSEILVLNEVHRALRTLPTQDAMVRVLKWVCNKLYVRAQFGLPERERLLRESREICGYVESKEWPDVEDSWEEDPVDEVVDIESSEDSDNGSEEKEA